MNLQIHSFLYFYVAVRGLRATVDKKTQRANSKESFRFFTMVISKIPFKTVVNWSPVLKEDISRVA